MFYSCPQKLILQVFFCKYEDIDNNIAVLQKTNDDTEQMSDFTGCPVNGLKYIKIYTILQSIGKEAARKELLCTADSFSSTDSAQKMEYFNDFFLLCDQLLC